ncbi:MAG: hypothetical protein DRN78_01170 [Thermoproteota archaeon]|nr:MAG: hypothetical protein DRN78_01170 [Candidatus Korarchaeota archaeon]
MLTEILRFLVSLIVSAIVLWAAQKIVLSDMEEKPFSSVVALAFVWAIVDAVLGFIFSVIRIPILGYLITLIAWIWILKSWFDVGWGKAILIAVIAWIISVILVAILGLLGLALLL